MCQFDSNMPSKKTQKWSSSASLTNFFSRITRTLSFSSKKNNKQSQPILKNNLSVPKTVPAIRRPPPQPISKILYNDDDVDEDYSRYSLQPNLSLFNISIDNLHNQQITQQQNDWLDDIFHSTKIE